jgi:hypothetical protein
MKRMANLVTILAVVMLAGCATPAPRAPVASEPGSTVKPAEKTDTSDTTRPKKDEEIDLGFEGKEGGSIVVEDSGVAPDEPPVEEPEGPEGSAESEGSEESENSEVSVENADATKCAEGKNLTKKQRMKCKEDYGTIETIGE